MTERPTREPFRPRAWWSPTQGVIEQVEPRWPDEPMRCVRTRDRYVVPVPDDAVELRTAPEPTGDAVETVARVLYDTANRDIGDPDPWEECGYRDVYRGMARAAIAAMPGPELTAEQVAYIKAATLQEEANWWEQVRPATVGRTQFGTWLRGRAEVHLRAAGIPVQDREQHG